MSDGQVTYVIGGNIDQLKRSLKDAGDAIDKATKGWEGAADNAAQGAEKAGRSMGDVLKGILAADVLKQAGKAILDFGKESVALASDLEEVQNVVDVTFGENSKQVDSWAKKASKSYGLTELQAKKFSSTMGAMLKSMGMSGKEVKDMSLNMTGLAADMASFYNLDHETAFEKIRAGISGETEPLKQLGINMSVANLEAYAMSQGITKGYEAMTQAEQAQLRYNYLLSVTADAQGDFARTSDGYANSLRVLENNFSTLKANIGEALLPVVSGAVTAINGLFDALTPEVTISDTFDDIETDYAEALASISGKKSIVQALVDELTPLEGKTRLTADEQTRWNAILAKLVETIPSLSEVIDLQTGEITGGTDAILAHAKAWATAAEDEAAAAVVIAKQRALREKNTEIITMKVEYKASYEQWQSSRGDMQSLEEQFQAKTGKSLTELYGMANTLPGMVARAGLSEEAKKIYEQYELLVPKEQELSAATADLGEKVATQSEALDLEAEKWNAYAASQGLATEATMENAAASGQLTEAQQSQIEQLIAIGEALQPLVEYQKEVRDATLQQVESIVNGFEAMSVGTEASIEGMIEGLNSQIAYMETYSVNMQEAARRGVDEGLLASLSDGSEKSAEYLQAILIGTDDDIKALNDAWKKTEDGKDAFTDVLADQKLKADEVYQGLVDMAAQKIAELDQSGAAKASLEATVLGIISGIDTQIPSLRAKVNEVLALLSSVSGADYSFGDIWLDRKLSRGTSSASGKTVGRYADGLERVPYDDFPAYLHKDESVLTAEEADIWRGLRGVGAPVAGNGNGAGMADLTQIGAGFWDSAPEELLGARGGDVRVYIGGEQVEAVVSRKQASAYSALERSGWHAGV